MMRVYVASSWRNAEQPSVVKHLRLCGHEVYDFRHPSGGDRGFAWSDIHPQWEAWNPQQFVAGLDHPLAKAGFTKDMRALDDSEAVVLVMPCGRSAHLEAGYARGAGKLVVVLLSDGEPELMYRMLDVCCTLSEVERALIKGRG